MQKKYQKVKLRTEATMQWREKVGVEVGKGDCQTAPVTNNLQQVYLQQKTEKFHLLSSPVAPTKLETGKRQTDGEKSCKS